MPCLPPDMCPVCPLTCALSAREVFEEAMLEEGLDDVVGAMAARIDEENELEVWVWV